MATPRPHGRIQYLIAAILFCLLSAPAAHGHMLVDDAMDVTIAPGSISVEVRISLDEVLLIEAHGKPVPSPEAWLPLISSHRDYVLSHLHFRANGIELVANPPPPDSPAGEATSDVVDGSDSTQMAGYHIEYPLTSPPATLRIEQDFLKEFDPSDANFVTRIRQNDNPQFKIVQLNRDSHTDFACHWKGEAATTAPATVQATSTHIDFWETSTAFLKQGIWHILTGYDHLLFVSALVLATNSLWDLIKVVFSFTLAHTLTLTLCVFNVVNLSSRIVEPMISTSIMLVALQNIFYPRQSTGWTRMAIAFGFGLFHGLGFAGGLKDAMSELPAMALWVSLISFSLGVEIGHQIVVLPLYAILSQTRKIHADGHRPTFHAQIQRYGSCVICVAGGYFLYQSLQLGA